ncbi:serine/threonine-protein kinase RsbT [Litorivivens lipolytica]|uniref:Serine/threonine-protein kinase RsbT n=1 Tax=Litorivivens lipolytica TaxID=1524264 RepID=A0A7W4W5H2_9GAMM|nr:ATP-binding protein [Litorivivens lipolytica]MBB3047841.1 serine/threonine-protein kinase RsbT [Litorivivens lipolytica]
MRALRISEADRSVSNVASLNHRATFDLPYSSVKSDPIAILVWETDDIVIARQAGRRLGSKLGCSDSKIALITTAISELARNMILYAGQGELSVSSSFLGNSKAVLITAQDDGPGIDDLDSALAGGYSTSGGIGLGLSGLSRISDKFEIYSDANGTCVKVTFRADTI